MLKVIPFAHQLIEQITEPGATMLDATCGNGNDTLFLSKLVGQSGHIYAFDIQEPAIAATKALLSTHNRTNVTCIQNSHDKVDQYLPEHTKGQLTAAIFNLGYLPKSDKTIITKPCTTIKAIEQLLPYLKTGGRIVVVIYHGHEGGTKEKDAVLNFMKELNQSTYEVLQYQFINQQNTPPFVVAVEKK